MRPRRTRLRSVAAAAGAALGLALLTGSAWAARLDPALDAAAGSAPLAAVVTFNGVGPPEPGDLALLTRLGLAATPLEALPMAVVRAPPATLRALAGAPRVRSIWHDRALAASAPATAAAALPHDGRWSGHGVGVLLATPGAAAAAGVHRLAPGAMVVGFRTGSGKSLSTALGAFDHALGHQFEHNIRVLWNPLAVLEQDARDDPDHPLQVALRALAERGVLVVVPPAADAGEHSVPWAITSADPANDGAPELCGVLALMLEANPALDWRQAREILSAHGSTAGRVDAGAVVRAALARGGGTAATSGRGHGGLLSGSGAQAR